MREHRVPQCRLLVNHNRRQRALPFGAGTGIALAGLYPPAKSSKRVRRSKGVC